MSDTQWPRYYVFKQDAADLPHLNCGSLHAPDPEMALLNARDVFVRRPDCVSLWVVPADQVHKRTRESLEESPPELPADDAMGEAYAVFMKLDWRKQQAHTGEVHADSGEAAVARALLAHEGADPLEVWAVPIHAISSSPVEDSAAWFAPAKDKPYRHSSFYHTDSLMREITKVDDGS